MRHNYIITILSLILVAGYSCKDSSDDEMQHVGANSIYATFENGEGFFNPETASPYEDTIRFVFNTYFPVESDQLIDITRMKLKAYYPVSVTVPGESGIIDLTTETPVTIVQSDGTKKNCIVKGIIQKSSEAQIKEFNLPVSNLPGFVVEQSKTIGLVPGGIEMGIQKPKLTLSPHATISPDTSLVQDFSQPVTYTVTAEDGSQATYTVKTITPEKLSSGLRKGSGRLLWSKTLSQMGIPAADNMTTALAVSGKYLVVNTRNVDNRYFNRFDGSYEGNMTMGGISAVNFKNFYSTNDNAGNILISNLTTANAQKLYVYRWNGVKDSAPVKYIEWAANMPGTSPQSGRKISVVGDLDGDALIFMGASATAKNVILRWQVTGGVLVSQTPDQLFYSGTKKWTYLADIISSGTGVTDNLFISGSPSDFVCTDVAGTVLGQVDLAASGYTNNHSLDRVTFNNVPYLAAISIASKTGFSYLYDVTDPARLSIAPSSPDFGTVCMYKTADIPSETNGNSTGDVLLKVSDDGYKMIMYTMVTNGSVAAYEFDCIDIDKL
ncbi:MAG: DUF5018 domain-containing protein [Mangrovibacterium sp.]